MYNNIVFINTFYVTLSSSCTCYRITMTYFDKSEVYSIIILESRTECGQMNLDSPKRILRSKNNKCGYVVEPN